MGSARSYVTSVAGAGVGPPSERQAASVSLVRKRPVCRDVPGRLRAKKRGYECRAVAGVTTFGLRVVSASRDAAAEEAMKATADSAVDKRAVVASGLTAARARACDCHEVSCLEVLGQVERAILLINVELACEGVVRPVVPAGARISGPAVPNFEISRHGGC